MYYLNHFLFYIELIRYYQCVNGKPYEHTCQAQLRWNQALAACDWSSNVQCSSAPMAISTKKSQEDALAESESVADERNSSSVSCSNGLCRSLSSEVQTLGNSASFIVNNPSTTTTTTTTTTEGKFIYLIYKFSFSVVQQNILQKQYKTKFLCSWERVQCYTIPMRQWQVPFISLWSDGTSDSILYNFLQQVHSQWVDLRWRQRLRRQHRREKLWFRLVLRNLDLGW